MKKLVLLMIVILISCSNPTDNKNDIPDLNTNDYMIPLKVGNNWEYENYSPYEDQYSFLIFKIEDKAIMPVLMYNLKTNKYDINLGNKVVYIENKDRTIYSNRGYTINEDFNLLGYLKRDIQSLNDTLFVRFIIPKNPIINHKYNLYLDTYRFDFTYKGKTTISIPAGVFDNVYEFTYISLISAFSDTTYGSIYLKKGIGILKIDKNIKDSVLYAKPCELKSYIIK